MERPSAGHALSKKSALTKERVQDRWETNTHTRFSTTYWGYSRSNMRTVNLSRYLQSGNAGGEAKALLEAFEHDGFAYLEGYQALVPQELVNTVLSYNEQFFQLPPEKKAALAFKSSLENRGYLKLGQEQASMSKDSKVIGSEREAHPGKLVMTSWPSSGNSVPIQIRKRPGILATSRC